jgi:hypothetical protein
MACSLFRRRKFDECVKVCTKLLEKNEYDQVNEIKKKQLLNSVNRFNN